VKSLVATRLIDVEAERVRRSHADAITELQLLAILGSRLIKNIEIADNTDIVVSHGLGRAPEFVWLSPVRQANANGIIREFRVKNPFTGVPILANKVVCLRADGFGSTIVFDMAVF